MLNLMNSRPQLVLFMFLFYDRADDHYVLELDFEPFNESLPRPTRSSSIGNGVQFLNRHLSSIMFRNKDCLEPLLNFLRVHKHKGVVSYIVTNLLSRCPLLQECEWLKHMLLLEILVTDADTDTVTGYPEKLQIF